MRLRDDPTAGSRSVGGCPEAAPEPPRRCALEIFRAPDHLGQLGGAIVIARAPHGDRVGLIDELGSLTFAEVGALEAEPGRYDTSLLGIVCCSNSQLEADLVRRAQRTIGEKLYNFYGSTEVAYATFATPEDLRAAPCAALSRAFAAIRPDRSARLSK